jgi:hypothetical protein
MPSKRVTTSVLTLFCLSAISSVLLGSNSANSAIYITKDSKVIILSGYSPDLMKQEVPQILRARLDPILQGLGRGLEDMFDAKAEFFSERNLNRRLDLQQISKGNPESIRTLFKREKYTHLVVADIEKLDENVGSVSVQLAKLSEDGSPTEWDMTPDTFLNPTQSDRELNTVLFNFRKFRAPDAPKRVNVLCIRPRSPVVGAHTPQTELESLLSKPITLELIDFYHTQKMKEKGYRPVVDDRTYEFYRDETKTIQCRPAGAADNSDPLITKISVTFPDYIIEGDVGVVGTPAELDSIVLTIKVVRKLPPPLDCRLPIRHDFDRSNYQGNKKNELSWKFSEQILRAKYETWSDNFETDASCK